MRVCLLPFLQSAGYRMRASRQLIAGPVPAVLGALAVLLVSPPALGLDPPLDISQYAHRAWTFREGFLNGAVNAFAQTADGYLWLGTESGLYRFDGVRTASAPLTAKPVGSLLTARDGALWIGTLDSLLNWKNGQLKELPAFRGRRINALLQDGNGTLWAATALGGTGRLCAIRGDSVNCYGEDGTLGQSAASLYEDSERRLWVGAANGLWRWIPGPPTRYLAVPILGRQALAQGDAGSGIIAAGDGVQQVAGAKSMNYAGLRLPSYAEAVLHDRDGGLWIGTQTRGLMHLFEARTSVFARKDGLSSDRVKALFEDREGTIWVGTSQGFDQFRRLPVTSLSVEQGLSNGTPTSVLAARDGSLWIGTADGLNRWNHGQMTIYRMQNNPGLPGDTIHSLYEDEGGRIWIAGYRGVSVFERSRFSALPAVPAGSKFVIAGDRQGGLWVSLWLTPANDGLGHLVEGKFKEQAPWRKLGGGPVMDLLPDPDGGVWTALFRGGLTYFREGQVRSLPLSGDGAAGARIESVSRGRGGALWAATESGLTRIAGGRTATLTTANGLPCDAVHWIMEDDRSSVWLYTRCGLLRVARNEMDAWIADPKRRIQVTTFDATDGIRLIPALDGFKPSVTKSSDGRIWFLNGDAVSVIDPSRLAINTLPPPVHVERITADHRTYDARRGLRLPPLVRDLTIDFTGLSFAAPEKVRFRYMLEGQDRDWKEVVNKREAQYSNLGPGHYRFHVTACNNSGLWSGTGDALEFYIAPAYYQTNWFRALCGSIFAAMLWASYRLRIRQLQREFNMRIEGRVEERTRIARELHDTLLQSVQGLMFSFQAARNLLPERTEAAMRTLDSAITEGDEAIAEGRNAIQGLRANPALESNLENLLAAARKEMASSSRAEDGPPDFQVAVEGTRRALSPLLQDDIYRIAREILRNAFHHAGASRIEAEIAYDRQFFRLRIRDNGIGIDPKVLEQGARQGHWGLPGVRERAKRIRGRLSLWSEPGAGTEAELTVPARIAYAKSDRRTRLRWFAGHKE